MDILKDSRLRRRQQPSNEARADVASLIFEVRTSNPRHPVLHDSTIRGHPWQADSLPVNSILYKGSLCSHQAIKFLATYCVVNNGSLGGQTVNYRRITIELPSITIELPSITFDDRINDRQLLSITFDDCAITVDYCRWLCYYHQLPWVSIDYLQLPSSIIIYYRQLPSKIVSTRVDNNCGGTSSNAKEGT